MTHELTDTQLNSLDQIHTNAVKSWLQMKPKGPTPAIPFSPDGLSLGAFLIFILRVILYITGEQWLWLTTVLKMRLSRRFKGN